MWKAGRLDHPASILLLCPAYARYLKVRHLEENAGAVRTAIGRRSVVASFARVLYICDRVDESQQVAGELPRNQDMRIRAGDSRVLSDHLNSV